MLLTVTDATVLSTRVTGFLFMNVSIKLCRSGAREVLILNPQSPHKKTGHEGSVDKDAF